MAKKNTLLDEAIIGVGDALPAFNKASNAKLQEQARLNLEKAKAQATAAQQPQPVIPKANITTPEVIKSGQTGEITGVELPGGKAFTGITPGDVQGIVTGFQQPRTLPEGTVPAGTAQAQAEKAQRLQQLMQQGLSQQELMAIEQAPIDWGQALTAGTVGNLPPVISRIGVGAAAGAAIGGAPTLGIGAIPGAIIGGIGGLISAIWSGTASNIKKQQTGEIGAAQDVLSQAKTNMKQLRMVAQTDPTKAEEAVNLYYQQLAQVQRAYRKVQVETQGNLNKFMEDGTDILSDFELFLMPGGYADIQRMRLEETVMTGTPATPEEIIQLYQEEFADGI